MDRTHRETDEPGSHHPPARPPETGERRAEWFLTPLYPAGERRAEWFLTPLYPADTFISCDLSSSTETVTQAHQQLTNYLRNNLHRTDYPTYVKNGWPIGSGRVESACKSVVATRLKGPGMRWRPRGTNALCHLRALFKSERSAWQSFWARDRKPRKLVA